MKKNIAFVALDSSLVRWMLEQLQKSKIAAPSAQELSEGLRDLMDGTAGSLMLELGEGEKKSNSRRAESEPPHIVRTVQKRGLQGVEQANQRLAWRSESGARPVFVWSRS